MKTVNPQNVNDYIGKHIGTSEWVLIDQNRINQFADVTIDHQFIHVDEEQTAKTPFETTIAHGFLTLSLLSHFAEKSVLVMDGIKMGVNYGFEKVRMMHPVQVNKKVRGHFTLMSVQERVPGQWVFKYSVKVEIEGEPKPALVAEWLVMQVV